MVVNNPQEWQTANYQYLIDLVQQLQNAIETAESTSLEFNKTDATVAEMHFERLCYIFRLSEFERNVLLLCLGAELLPTFTSSCAKRLTHDSFSHPTVEIALTLFKNNDWDAFAEFSPLCYWGLISVKGDGPLRQRQIKITEDILYYLMGKAVLNYSLSQWLQPLKNNVYPFASHQTIAQQLIEHWSAKGKPTAQPLCVHFSGIDHHSQQNVALLTCTHWGSAIYRIDGRALAMNSDLNNISRLLVREARLQDCLYWLEYDSDTTDLAEQRFLKFIVETLPMHCVLVGEALPPAWLRSYVQNWSIPLPSPEEQLTLWQSALAADKQPAATQLEQLTQQFSLNAEQIQRIADKHNHAAASHDNTSALLWRNCQEQISQSLSGLAKIIEPKANWQDLALPETQRQILRTLVTQVKQRFQVYQQWGFADKSNRGLGICALFHGPSGTGKTLAAEVMAHELALNVYHIDLSAIVSKYIGETEKQLKKIFDNAEASGAILLFDEADTIFGKRSEVKDSHDRYANMQVGYLLQRMEAYRGLSILTTNLKNSLDEAFLRRIRFIVQFPFPDYAQRIQIWQRIFPSKTPIQSLDWAKLARLNLTGGHIRNIALNAAFIAAEKQQSVMMPHLLQATQAEYGKLEKTLTDNEVRDWI